MKEIYKVVSLYCFIPRRKESILNFKKKLIVLEELDLSGLIIIAEEGINGTICGNEKIVNRTIKLINEFVDNKELNQKISFSKEKIFKTLKIKIKLKKR